MNLQGEDILFRSAYNPATGNIDLYLWVTNYMNGEKQTSVAKNIEFENINTGEEAMPIARLCLSEAETLMNELWKAGVRPTNGEGSVGQLGATERHLEDMRTLVFKSAGGAA